MKKSTSGWAAQRPSVEDAGRNPPVRRRVGHHPRAQLTRQVQFFFFFFLGVSRYWSQNYSQLASAWLDVRCDVRRPVAPLGRVVAALEACVGYLRAAPRAAFDDEAPITAMCG